MLGFILAGLRRRAGRSLAMLAGILVATTGFTVLTGATATSRLQVDGTVEGAGRPAYDLLVRPRGTRDPDEAGRGVVRANALAGQYGGLTEDDLRAVAAVPGVDVAAPIAMIGYVNTTMQDSTDLTSAVDRSRDRQVIRVDPTYFSERGLSSARARPSYVYVTKHPLLFSDPVKGSFSHYTYGGEDPPDNNCGNEVAALEIQPDGRRTAICGLLHQDLLGNAASTDLGLAQLTAVRLMPDGRFQRPAHVDAPATATDRLICTMSWQAPLLLAAIDPQAEDRLVGLRGALTTGAYPAPGESVRLDRQFSVGVPVLATDRPPVEGGIHLDYSRLDLDALPAGNDAAFAKTLDSAPSTPLGRADLDNADAYRQSVLKAGPDVPVADLETVIRTGPVKYTTGPNGVLRPAPLQADPHVYDNSKLVGVVLSWQIGDVSFRPTTLLDQTNRGAVPEAFVTGTYDAGRLTHFDPLTKVPLETYEQTPAIGADKRTTGLLDGASLSPGGNPAGYLLGPPALLTTIEAAKVELGSPRSEDLISAIRVRVTGVDGYSAENAERVRLVAERIAASGLEVDITLGSSLAPQTVALAPGAYGRPELTLTESWVRKGVARTVEQAVDRKSLILFVLVLVVCALFVANAVTAAVRSRTAELAVLACLGWPPRKIGTAVLGEVAALGLLAGIASLALAMPLGTAFGVQTSWPRALAAVPVALAIALTAGLVPARRAARTPPADLLQPMRARRRRSRLPRTVTGMGLAGMIQVPGRTLLATGALALGVAALSILAAVTFAFHGAIVGTVLGDAVSVTARRVDVVAALVTVALGALAVADVLYLNIRDRGAELATLRATGWTDATLTRLVVTEGGGIGLVGGIAGAGIGLAAAALLVHAVTWQLLATTAAAALAGTLVATLSALAPALLIRRLPTAQLLTEE